MTTTSPSTRLGTATFVCYALGVGLIQFNVRAEGFLVLALLLALPTLARTWRQIAWPPFVRPLAILAGWSLVGAALSGDPASSLIRARQLLLYLIVPLTIVVAPGRRATRTIDVIIALGAAAALVGIVQYVALGYDVLNNRPRGFIGHYMTFSGVLMLVITAAMARLLFRDGEWLWPAVAVPALLVALAFTMSRNVWVGTAMAVGVLLTLRRRVLLVALPVALVVASVIAPAAVRQRALSAFDPNDPSNRDRIAMLKAGVGMIKAHPAFGVGLNMVPQVYLQYRTADAVDSAEATGPETRSHLHNVPMQLAAERGIPALAAWLWFVVAAGRDLLGRVRRGIAHPAAAAGLGALVAMVTAGFFEHNFGDSEFLILFLALVSLPYAATLADDGGKRA